MKTKLIITKDIEIEDLVRDMPESVTYMMKKGIRCLQCGEPVWGSLESAVIEKGFSKHDLQLFVRELNELAAKN